MNVTVFHQQILLLMCPCAQTCRLRPHLDDLADRLRREMQYGRDYSRGPIDPSVTDTMGEFHDSFQHN